MCKALSIVSSFWKGKTEYKYFNDIKVVTEPYSYIVQLNLTFSTSHLNIVEIFAKVFVILLISSEAE